MCRPDTLFANVECVYSHPQALAQCAKHIELLFPKAVLCPVSSTADAARIVANEPGLHAVAIGSPKAAQAYGLLCKPEPIEDHPGNVTRFGLVGSTAIQLSGCAEMMPSERVVSLCLVGVAHQPGGLVGVLQPFAQAGLNLARVESRPVGDELGNYMFYLDISMAPHDKEAESTLASVLHGLAQHGTQVIRLGTYLVFPAN